VSTEHRILVVDDEPNIVELVSMALRYQGFAVASAGNGQEALAQVTAFRPHLVVLDVMLPDMDGFEVAERLGAQRADIPIVFLTARDATPDKIRGLTAGGDDYVTKPFSLEELVARIRAILRRAGAAEPEDRRLVFDDVEMDEDTREVTRAGNPIELTATEYRLLRFFLLNPRKVLHDRAHHHECQGLEERHAVHVCHEGFDELVDPVRHVDHIDTLRTTP
jgi:two-component system, OmpR family, response regulator